MELLFPIGAVVLGLVLAGLIGIAVFGHADQRAQRHLRRGAVVAAAAYAGLFMAWFLVSAL